MRWFESKRTRRLTVIIVVLLLLGWYLMPENHFQKALEIQKQILESPDLVEPQLTRIYDEFGRHLDALTPDEREQVWTARRALERQTQIKKLDEFFALGEAGRNAWLDAEIKKRAVNDAQQRREEQAAAQQPPMATFPGSISQSAEASQLDAASREMLDTMSAEDRAKITEYERLYYARLEQRRK